MATAVETRTPTHLWIVGILSLLWNCFGAYDYTMTRLRNVDYLSQMGDPTTILAYVDSLPLYAHLGWGLGVWAGLAGAVLLLMRHRWAVLAFAISLVGMALSFGGQYLSGTEMPPEMTQGGMQYMPLLIVLLGLTQFAYARLMEKRGVLR